MLPTPLLLLLAALPGLWLVRSAPPLARLLALVAMVGLLLAAMDPRQAVATQRPAQVGLACSARGAAADAATAALQQRATAAGSSFRAVSASPAFADAIAAASLRAGPRADELLLLWTGPLPPALPPLQRAAAALTAAVPFPLRSDALHLHATGPLAAGRPVAFELSATDLRAPVVVEVAITGVGGDELLREKVQLAPGRSAVLRCTPPQPGPLQCEARIETDGARLLATGSCTVAPPRPVLVLEHLGVAAAALRAQGVTVVEATELPAELDAFTALVVGEPLPEAAQRRVVAAVQDGFGLFAFGAALPAPGAPLRAVLPLQPTPQAATTAGSGPGNGVGNPGAASPERATDPTPPPADKPPQGDTSGAKIDPSGPAEVMKRAIAMVLIVDRSGSMGSEVRPGQTKMSFAITSALHTAQALGDGDEVGIVTFGNQGQGRIEMPLTPANERDKVKAGVAKLRTALEQTYLHAGMQKAQELLAASKAPVRHAVVISDGEIVLDEEIGLVALARTMHEQGITISIVQIAGDTTSPLQRATANKIATTGGGTYVVAPDAARVPVLVSAELQRALGKVGRTPRDGNDPSGPPADPKPNPEPERPRPAEPQPKPPEPSPQPSPADREHGLVPVRAVAKSQLLEPMPAGDWPSLGAAAVCTGELDAYVLLVAGARGTPLLAFCNRGLGRVGAFAADLAGGPGAAFRADLQFPARLSQWVASVRPPEPTPPDELLAAGELQPARPTPEQVDALQATAKSRLRALGDWTPPPPSTAVEHVAKAAEWALGGVLLLLLLALGEWWCGRARVH
jgi:Mg-chelatase subunit ChlD